MVWRQCEGGGGWVKDLGVILVVGLGEACTHVATLLVAVEAIICKPERSIHPKPNSA